MSEQSAENQEQQQAPQTFAEPPDWLPEKFHVKGETGTFDPVESFSKALHSYRDLETTLHAGKEKLRGEVEAELQAKMAEGIPDSPDGYTFELDSQKLGLEEGIQISVPDDDPMLTAFREVAAAHKIPTAAFNDAVNAYMAVELKALDTINEERAKLGDDPDGRVDRLERKLASNLPDSVYQGLVKTLPVNATLVEALELLTANMEDRTVPGDIGGQGTPALTRDDILEAMNDPRYLNNDSAYHDKIQAMWRTLARSGR